MQIKIEDTADKLAALVDGDAEALNALAEALQSRAYDLNLAERREAQRVADQEAEDAAEAARAAVPQYHFHPDCTECCRLGHCHWCLIKPMSGQIAEAPDGYMYAMCAAHIRYFREITRGRSIDAVGFDVTSVSDRHHQATGLSPLLYVPTQKQAELG